MKKSLFLLGAAAMIIAGCAKETVTRVADNRAIQFDTHIDNTTKAVTEVKTENLKNYFVFGYMADATNSYATNTPIYENIDPSLAGNERYWTTGKFYRFAAYADGDNGQIQTNVAFAPTTNTLTFTDYKVAEKDLVAAVPNEVNCTDPGTQAAVSLSFKHMLSQVMFTLTNNETDKDLTISVSDIKIKSLVNTGTGNFDGSTITWTKGAGTGAELVYTNNSVPGDITTTVKTFASESKMVLPQEGTDKIEVTFNATVKGKGLDVTKAITATLGVTTTNKWEPGYKYNYTANLNAANIAGTKPITFTAKVEAWQDATEQNATIQTLK